MSVLAVEDGNSRELLSFTRDGAKKRLDVSTGLATMPGFNIPPYTRIDVTYPTTSSEVFVYKDGATIVATITATYTDATKNYLLSAVKS